MLWCIIIVIVLLTVIGVILLQWQKNQQKDRNSFAKYLKKLDKTNADLLKKLEKREENE